MWSKTLLALNPVSYTHLMAGRDRKRDRPVPCVHAAAHRAARCSACLLYTSICGQDGQCTVDILKRRIEYDLIHRFIDDGLEVGDFNERTAQQARFVFPVSYTHLWGQPP